MVGRDQAAHEASDKLNDCHLAKTDDIKTLIETIIWHKVPNTEINTKYFRFSLTVFMPSIASCFIASLYSEVFKQNGFLNSNFLPTCYCLMYERKNIQSTVHFTYRVSP